MPVADGLRPLEVGGLSHTYRAVRTRDTDPELIALGEVANRMMLVVQT